MRPTRRRGRCRPRAGRPERLLIWPCSRWRIASHDSIARIGGGLLPHPFTLARALIKEPLAVWFLWPAQGSLPLNLRPRA